MRDFFDVIIIGGGIAGASLGAEIVAPGRPVLIVEAEAHCGYHSTGRSAAFYLESYGGADVAILSRASHSFLADPPESFSPTTFLRPRGALHVGRERWPTIPSGIESRRVERAGMRAMVPALLPAWDRGLLEPGCADIDVAALHDAYLRMFRSRGGVVRTNGALVAGSRRAGGWTVEIAGAGRLDCGILVNAAGAWGDRVAAACGVAPIGLSPRRRTMLQVRVGQSGLRDLPLVSDADGGFYFKGEGNDVIWLSPHDEVPSDPCDAAPEEIDVAVALHRLSEVVDWPVEAVERRWAGLRTFAPDRLPAYGFDRSVAGFFWCVGQGGFGIQTAPAAAQMAAAMLTDAPGRGLASGIDPRAFDVARW